MLIKSITQQHCCFSLKPYSREGFEPGSSVPEADAMATESRRQGIPVLLQTPIYFSMVITM
jgi:hypothetical protein